MGTGPRWLARLWSGSVQRILDRVHRGLARGSIMASLPDGATRLIGGHQLGFDAVVELKSWRALLRLATAGSVGWYQAWEAGEWDSPDPVPLFALFMDNAVTLGGVARARGPWRIMARVIHAVRRNSRAGSLKNIHAHYDLGNDFYEQWLGETMLYSSALYVNALPSGLGKGATPLDRAQSAKMETIVERLKLEEGQQVLEIGCGWGALAAAIASHKDVRVDAISLSDAQLAYAAQRWGNGSGRINFRKQDYRDIGNGEDGPGYDAIVSVEMVEAVGRAYWPDFLDCLARNLRAGGRAAIQFISIDDSIFDRYASSADFIQTFIFPGGMLIRESEFRALAAERGLTWEDRLGFGQDYARTLREWRRNFDAAVDEGRLPAGFDERFVRMWRFYLMYCEGGFMGGGIDVAQVTLVKV